MRCHCPATTGTAGDGQVQPAAAMAPMELPAWLPRRPAAWTECRVFATAGSAEKCAACEGLGAERCINYRVGDFVAVVREQTAGRGVDVVLDMVGGAYFARNLDALATEGRLVEIATLQGAKAELNIQTIMQRRLTITGSTLRARPIADKGVIAAAVHRHVWPLLESGAVKPIIHATFPLREAAQAHRVMESSAHIGKLVLIT